MGGHVACTGEARSVNNRSLMKELYIYIWKNNIEMNRNISVMNGLIIFRIGVSGRFL